MQALLDDIKEMEVGNVCRTSALIFFVPRPGDIQIEMLVVLLVGPLSCHISVPCVCTHSTRLESSYRLEAGGKTRRIFVWNLCL